MFTTYTEVPGEYTHHVPGTADQTPRIDRILVPRQELIDAGWTYGPVGVECKRSGADIGRPISQLLDYSRAAFRLGRTGAWLHLQWVFLWPLEPQHGALASVMAQNRLGGAKVNGRGALVFHSGATNLAVFPQSAGTPAIKHVNHGRKVGSR